MILAILATTLSQVPGGLGIIEFAVLTYVVQGKSPAAVAALVVFRIIYYVVPLLIATLSYFLFVSHTHRGAAAEARHALVKWGAPIMPMLLALLAFISGVVLLLSGATPPLPSRLVVLERLLPISVLETSHLTGSLVGTLLLVLSRGLARRFDSAWLSACGLVAVGIVASLLKGLDWEEAALLGTVFLLLIAGRQQFYRRGTLLHTPLSAPWLAAMVVAVSAATWIGVFSHKHVEYSNDLWWQVAYRAVAPRFMRATLVSAVTLLIAATISLYRGARPKQLAPTTNQLALAASIIAHQPSTDALLALVGDKTLLFNEQQSAFVMFAQRRRSWIALGDPVGPPCEAMSMAWQFHEFVDAHGGLTAFYHIPAKSLPTYLELGLTPIKVGDFGRVPLDEFTYEAPLFKELRQARNRYHREGFVFDIVGPQDVPAVLPRLKEVSDQWLAAKNTAEKRFSVGYFNSDYLTHTPLALVQSDRNIVAFANILATEMKDEISVDLMRHVQDVPHGVMDFLFGQLMQCGKEQGYQSFSLGMAPLSGLASHPLSPVWNRVGNAIYRHGEHFYNFNGLRKYKEKFQPKWEPYYLLFPGGFAIASVLLDLASLCASGVKRTLTK